MKLLLVSEPASEGVASCVVNLAVGARRAGVDVTVVCPADGALSERLRLADVAVAGVSSRGRVGWLRRAPERVRAHARDADVVHLHSTFAGLVGRLPGVTTAPIVYSPHAWAFYRGGAAAPLYRVLESQLASHTDHLVLVSDEEARSVQGWRLAVPDGISVVPNGVDLDRFCPEPGVDSTHDVVCIGRLSRQKGQDLLLRALAAVAPHTRVALIGGGPDRTALEQLARRLHLTAVDFVGPVPDVRSWLARGRVVVVPSRWDGMSLGLLEALACGRPVVATNVSGTDGLAEVVVRVPIAETEALGNAICELLASPVRCADLGARARALVEARYSLDRSVQAHLQVWDRLARRTGPIPL